jgi:hypothetical protein
MTKTVQEVINFLWANNAKGGVDIDGLYGKNALICPKRSCSFVVNPLGTRHEAMRKM